MKRRSFLKTVGTAGLAAGVTPAWGTYQAADRRNPHPSSSDAKKNTEQASPETDMFSYHWSLNGFGLPDDVLRKVYHANAEKILSSQGRRVRT